MRRTIALLMLAAVYSAPAQLPTADDLAAKYVAATGGAQAWASVQTLTVSSRSEFFSFDLAVREPGMIRHDAWSDDTSEVDTRAFDGSTGWRINTSEGTVRPRSMSAAEIDELRADRDWMFELVTHKARGYRLEPLATETIMGKRAHKVRMTRPDGEVLDLWLDDASGLEVRRVRYAQSPDGERHQIVIDVGDYRKVGPLLLPHRAGPATRTYSVNTPIDAAKFRRPGQPEASLARERQASVASRLLPIGSVAPEWALQDAAGRLHRSLDYKDRVVVMDFWAVWCAACHAMMPGLQQLHSDWSGRGVVVLGISAFEHAADPAQFFRDRQYTYPVLLHGETIADAFSVAGLPTVYVVGIDGRIIDASAGAGRADEARRRQVIDAHLKQHGKVPDTHESSDLESR